MVYTRTGEPDETVVVKEHRNAETRVAWDEISGYVSVEHASGKTVHQGLRFDDPETVDRLIEALQDLRPRMEADDDE